MWHFVILSTWIVLPQKTWLDITFKCLNLQLVVLLSGKRGLGIVISCCFQCSLHLQAFIFALVFMPP